MSFPSVKLRPGLEKLSEMACADDRLDSAIGSMTKDEAETMEDDAIPDECDDALNQKTESPELRAELERLREHSAREPTRVDSAFGSMDTAAPLHLQASETTDLMAELNISAPPGVHRGVSSALSSSVRRAMVAVTEVSEEEKSGEKNERSAGDATAVFVENTSCHNYACSGDERYLLAAFRALLFSPNEDGDTALHVAVINFQVKAVRQILGVLPSVSCLNLTNKLGQTPLHLAVITNQPILVKVFVQRGADLAKVDRRGNTALHLAARNGAKECTQFLLTVHPDGRRCMTRVECRNYDGLTALHVAVLNSQQDIVRLLISNGADVDCQDLTCGRSPLHYAVENEMLAMASVLLFEFHANVNAQTFDSNIPLHTAAGRNMSPMVALLIAAGADKNMKNGEGDRPLDLTKDKHTLAVFHRMQQ